MIWHATEENWSQVEREASAARTGRIYFAPGVYEMNLDLTGVFLIGSGADDVGLVCR